MPGADEEVAFAVGDIVQLSSNPDEVRTSFDSVPFQWSDMMIPMCGQTFTVLEVAEDPDDDESDGDGLPEGIIGLASPDGSQGNVWYFPTAVLTKLRTKKEHALLMKYSMAIGKAIAGTVRFILEDALQGMCQVVFLIKKWHFTTFSSKAFTLSSIFTGVTLSLVVPLKEYLTMRSTEEQAKALRPELARDLKLDQKNEGRPGTDTGEVSGAWRDDDPMKTTIGRDMYIAEYLQNRGFTQQHATVCHKVLAASSFLFWSSMLMLAFVERPVCGGNQHLLRYFLFIFVTVVDLAVQVWVILHSRLGYHLVIYKPAKPVSGLILTVLGHFDSFADVTFATMLQNCEPITNFTIKERYFHPSYWQDGDTFEGDRVFQLPFELRDVSLIALFVGVFAFQAVPGFVMLIQKKWLPLAFKMNEFNLLLALMDAETVYMDGQGFAEDSSAKTWLDTFRAGAASLANYRLLARS